MCLWCLWCLWPQMLRIWRVEQFIEGGWYHMHTAILRSHWRQWNPQLGVLLKSKPFPKIRKMDPKSGQSGSKWLWTKSEIGKFMCNHINHTHTYHMCPYVPCIIIHVMHISISWSKPYHTVQSNWDSKWSASQRGHRYGSRHSSCLGAHVQSCCLPAQKHHIEEPTQKPHWQIVSTWAAAQPTQRHWQAAMSMVFYVYDFRMPFLSLDAAWYTYASGL